MAAAPFHISTSNIYEFQFLYIITNTCYFPFLSFFFFIIAILVGVKKNLTVLLTCISLMTNDVEHLFMYLAVCISSLEKCLFKSFALKKIFFLFSC